MSDGVPRTTLPSGWAWATISDLIGPDGVFSDGDWVESKDQDPQGEVRLIQLADIGDSRFLDRSNRSLTNDKAETLGCLFLQAGDVLVARMPDPLGRACQFPGSSRPCVTVVDVAVVRSGDPGVDHRWLVHFINAPAYRAKIEGKQSGTTRKRISRGNLAELSIPVPPLPEQQRIVEELDIQLDRVAQAETALRRVRKTVERAREAVLQAACEGRLVPTEAELAKAEGRSFETGTALLKRVSDERQRRWEERELSRLRAAGKEPSADWKSKYVPPRPVDVAETSSPEGWVATSLDALCEVQGGIQKQPSRRPAKHHFPFLRVANVKRGKLELTDVHRIELFQGELDTYRLEPGDLLIVEGNGSLSEIGRMACWDASIDNCVHQNHLIRARPLSGVLPKFVENYWNSVAGQEKVREAAATTSGLYTLSVSKVEKLPIALAPLAEQARIVAAIEDRFTVLEHIMGSVEASLTRCERLRQSLLQMAFEGRLVPQTPEDESATILLSRIRATREAREEERRRSRSAARANKTAAAGPTLPSPASNAPPQSRPKSRQPDLPGMLATAKVTKTTRTRTSR